MELRIFKDKVTANRVEAREWLKGKREGFACNYFNDLDSFKHSVERLYTLGVPSVEVEVDENNGNYADTLFVRLPKERGQVIDVLLEIATNQPDEITAYENKEVIMLWWD